MYCLCLLYSHLNLPSTGLYSIRVRICYAYWVLSYVCLACTCVQFTHLYLLVKRLYWLVKSLHVHHACRLHICAYRLHICMITMYTLVLTVYMFVMLTVYTFVFTVYMFVMLTVYTLVLTVYMFVMFTVYIFVLTVYMFVMFTVTYLCLPCRSTCLLCLLFTHLCLPCTCFPYVTEDLSDDLALPVACILGTRPCIYLDISRSVITKEKYKTHRRTSQTYTLVLGSAGDLILIMKYYIIIIIMQYVSVR